MLGKNKGFPETPSKLLSLLFSGEACRLISLPAGEEDRGLLHRGSGADSQQPEPAGLQVPREDSPAAGVKRCQSRDTTRDSSSSSSSSGPRLSLMIRRNLSFHGERAAACTAAAAAAAASDTEWMCKQFVLVRSYCFTMPVHSS